MDQSHRGSIVNRRELFRSIVGAAAAAGVTVKASSLDEPTDPTKRPALVVLECSGSMSQVACANLTRNWKHAVEGTVFEGVKAVVLGDGMRLTVVAEDGTILNRTIEA
jgi:anti-sigma-K factor RskA